MAIPSSDDFTVNALADNGVTITLTPITKTISNVGDETLTEGTSASVTAIIHVGISSHTQEKMGLSKDVVGYIMVAPTITIGRDYIVEYQSIQYRLDGIVARGPSGDIAFYKYANLYLLGE